MFWFILAFIMFLSGNTPLGFVFLLFGFLFSDSGSNRPRR